MNMIRSPLEDPISSFLCLVLYLIFTFFSSFFNQNFLDFTYSLINLFFNFFKISNLKEDRMDDFTPPLKEAVRSHSFWQRAYHLFLLSFSFYLFQNQFHFWTIWSLDYEFGVCLWVVDDRCSSVSSPLEIFVKWKIKWRKTNFSQKNLRKQEESP